MVFCLSKIALIIFLVFLNPIEGRRLISLRCFNSIISFGDSLTDTGNEFYLTRYRNPSPYFARLPYGETFFHRPTGRFSNGRLIINFIGTYNVHTKFSIMYILVMILIQLL